MCAGLMHQARVDRCVYGAADPKAGALGTLYAVNADAVSYTHLDVYKRQVKSYRLRQHCNQVSVLGRGKAVVLPNRHETVDSQMCIRDRCRTARSRT